MAKQTITKTHRRQPTARRVTKTAKRATRRAKRARRVR